MYAVGVGKAVEEELREIASEPAELHVSYSPDFSTMTHLLENLKGSICPGEHIWLQTPPLLSLPNLWYLPYYSPPFPLQSYREGVDSLDAPLLPKPAAGLSLGNLLELQCFQLSPDLMNQILHLNKTLREFICLLKFRKH